MCSVLWLPSTNSRLTTTLPDLQLEGGKLGKLRSCWVSRLERRARKESGASEDSTRTQDTQVKSVSGKWLPLTEELEDSLTKVRTRHLQVHFDHFHFNIITGPHIFQEENDLEIKIWIKDNESKVKVIPHLRRAIRFDAQLSFYKN